jgi:hypothetical protein
VEVYERRDLGVRSVETIVDDDVEEFLAVRKKASNGKAVDCVTDAGLDPFFGELRVGLNVQAKDFCARTVVAEGAKAPAWAIARAVKPRH